ncbi:MAG: MFS transporter [Solirubrobacteraceae bacterium]
MTAFFALDGFLFANWVVRVPAVKAHVGASAGTLGLALLGISAGAVVTMMFAGALCSRFGNAPIIVGSATLMSLALMAPARVATVAALAAVLVVFGAGFGGLNVAMNSSAVEIAARLRRPIMPSFHAAYSLGGLSGAVVGGALAGVLGASTQLTGVGAFGLVLTACGGPLLLRLEREIATTTEVAPLAPDATDSRPGVVSRPRAVVAVFGLIALCSSYGEGAMGDWGALHLRTDLHTSVGLAAAGYASFSAAMVVGRLSGSAMLRRAGRTFVLAAGALTAAAGMLLAALAPDLVLAIVGFLLVGLGLANLFPAAVGEAGALAGPGGVAAASVIGYSGFLAGPPLIGFLAQRVGLPAALTSISALAALAAFGALAAHRIAPEP